ncbi:sulfur carrier protein ThiS [Deferrisoma camini]|uniref:sulfur carrier protein ThiS n=1 Tax=Deferrisoma camini TaxID=1035120 RepID=UPI00046CD5BA|nr:sulfur carrier protein ThiS [Deferrisoma camini]
MTVVVNGEPRPVDAGTTLGALLVSLGVRPATVVVERNGEVVPRDAFDRTVLAEGDRLEVVRFVGGG